MKDWGPTRATLFLMGLLLGIAFLHSWRGVEQDPATGEPAILEAQSVWRLRRVALAIETSRLAQTDSFRSFPTSSTSTDLPLYDEVIALGVRAMTAGSVGAPHRGVDEGLLQTSVLRMGPLFALILCLGLYQFLKVLRWGSLRANCLAVLWCCSIPVFLQHSQPGALSIELFTAIEALGAGALLIAVFRSGADLDRFTIGMVAGGLCGIGLVTSPLFLCLLFAAWCAYIWESLRNQGEERTEWTRAFLLFWITCALGSQLPSLGGPWMPSHGGNPHGWTQLCSWLIIGGAAPFLMLLYAPNKSWQAPARVLLTACIVLAFVGGCTSAFVLGADHENLALIFGSLQSSGGNLGAPELSPGLLSMLLLTAFGALQVFRAWRTEWSAIGVLFVVWGLLSSAALTVHEPAGLLFLPVAGGVAVRALDAQGARRALTLVGLALALGCLAWDSHREHTQPDVEGLAILQAARELRGTTSSPGAFNTVHPVHDWGVLCDERTAPLLAWYGQRPGATLGPSRNGDVAGRANLEHALAAGSKEEFHRRLTALGIRWTLLGPHSSHRLAQGGKDFPILGTTITGAGEHAPMQLRQVAGL